MTALLIAAVLCAQAEDIVVIDDVLAKDGPEFVLVPFEVPAGIVEIEVRHSSVSGDDAIDFGVEDPERVRGWGGGNDEPAIIGALAASRSYVPGPLPVGTWHVVVGKARLVSEAPAFRLEIVRRTTATLQAAIDRAPYTPTTLSTTARFYAGDLHVHSQDSGDARPDLAELAAFASTRGLDFVVVTDHNTDAHIERIAAAQPAINELLLIPGVEFTTYQGHMGAMDVRAHPDHKLGVTTSLDDVIRSFRAQDSVLTINHPNLDLGDVCIGCAWGHGIVDVDAVEIATGGLRQSGFIFGEGARTFWEDLVIGDGKHVAPVGGSDDHRAGVDIPAFGSPIGDPTTLIFASELSAAALRRGIKDSRTVVKLQGPDDPMIVLDTAPARSERNGKADTIVVEPGTTATLTATVTGAVEGDTFAFIVRGRRAAVPVAVPDDPHVFTLDIEPGEVGEEIAWRAEVQRDGSPRTITGYVWLRAEEPTGCGGCHSNDMPAVFALFFVGAVVTKRRHARTSA